jgi:hypothetical protein
MTGDDLDAAAQALYEANGNRESCPPWENLGDVTRGLWRERALEDSFGDLA